MSDPQPLIEIDRVSFGYDASRTILNEVSLRFARGKVTAILGGSGCGKTTLLVPSGWSHGTSKLFVAVRCRLPRFAIFGGKCDREYV